MKYLNEINVVPHSEQQYQITLDYLKTLNGKFKVLEVGSGKGILKFLITKNFDYESLGIVHTYGIKGGYTYDVDLDKQKIPVEDNVFDILVCLETLEHLQKPVESLKEFKRIVKEDGRLILSMPNEYNFIQRIYYLFGKKTTTTKPFRLIEEHLHIHNPRVKDILNLFEEEFEIEEIKYLWQSQASNKSKGARLIDKLINVLAQIMPSLFSRLVLVIAKQKEQHDSSEQQGEPK